MPMSGMGAEARNQIAENGHAIVPSWLDPPTVCERSDSSMPDTQESAICGGLREPVLGSDCFAVRHFFNIKETGRIGKSLVSPSRRAAAWGTKSLRF